MIKTSPTSHNIKVAYPDKHNFKVMTKNYLRMISDAIHQLDDNYGTLRKDIWDYLSNHYTTYVEYRDFLVSIKTLIYEGTLINEDGYFKVDPTTYEEIWGPRDSSPSKHKMETRKRQNSIKDNPLIPKST